MIVSEFKAIRAGSLGTWLRNQMVGSIRESGNKGLGEGVECRLFSPASETSIKEVPISPARAAKPEHFVHFFQKLSS